MSKQSALKNTLYSTIATYVEYFFGLVISILIARQLGPDQFGVYSYLMWLVTLSIILINGGISIGGIKFIAEARAKDVSQDIFPIYRYFQQVQIKKLAVYLLVTCLFVYFFSEQLVKNIAPELLYVVIGASVIKTFHTYCISIFKGFEDFRTIAIVVGIVSPINFVLVLVCYFTVQPLEVFLMVYLIVSITYLLISYPLLFKKIRQYKEKKAKTSSELRTRMSKHLWTTSWTAILSFIVLRQSELFFLNLYSTHEQMAFFNVGYSLAFAAITLVPGVYSAILLPLMARKNKEKGGRSIAQLKLALRYMLKLIIAIIFPVCFYAEEIFEVLYGHQYSGAILSFQVILICTSLKTLSDCTIAYLLSIDKQALILKLNIVASILTLSLDYYLIKKYQLTGALIAFSISTFFLACAFMVLAIRKLKFKPQWKIYIRTIISGVIAILCVSPITHYLPNIYGVIIGSVGYVIIYILMLLFTFSFRHDDVRLFRRLNLFVFKLINRKLVKLQNRNKIA